MIKGLVQGVGFRPYIYRLAVSHGLTGEVINRSDGVAVMAQGDNDSIEEFRKDIIIKAPPASQIKSIEISPRNLKEYSHFSIAVSERNENQITEISPDIAVCDDCLADISDDPLRKDYPFVNCTNCGPRFTIIEGLPYDRGKTSMKDFVMCADCRAEFESILDRRFHAQPIACNSCGPVYRYSTRTQVTVNIQAILNQISQEIGSGRTVAVKGIGGYFLMCDALNNNAVSELRRRKHRDSKPFAVMFRDIECLREYCFTAREEEEELQSWRRPVLILKQKVMLSHSAGSGLNTTGAMLPYMPLHYMLFEKLKTPAVVLTSGNFSDEPIITDDHEAEEKLGSVADSVLSYNRKIINRTDDSVVRIIDKKISLIRRSRGFVPRPVELLNNAEGILAMGAEQKNSFCIGSNNQALMSQHIGDLKSLAAFDFFKETIDRFSDIFRFRPELIACDLHPDYLSTIYAGELANQLDIPVVKVQHHHAHIASCLAEHKLEGEVIGVCLDGTGYGSDDNTWGGEFLVAGVDGFTRFTHFDYVAMPGGNKAITEPWRMAFSYLYKYFGESIDYSSIPFIRSVTDNTLALMKDMINNDLNSPLSSGAGRLFDAVSSITGLCNVSSFDSEAPMRLESVIDNYTDDHYPFRIEKTVIFGDTLRSVLEDLPGQNVPVISARFHNTVAHAILEVSEWIRSETFLNRVILSGGVFQNKYLTEKSLQLLRNAGFEVLTNTQVPANDGGISLGQLIIASKTRNLCA